MGIGSIGPWMVIPPRKQAGSAVRCARSYLIPRVMLRPLGWWALAVVLSQSGLTRYSRLQIASDLLHRNCRNEVRPLRALRRTGCWVPVGRKCCTKGRPERHHSAPERGQSVCREAIGASVVPPCPASPTLRPEALSSYSVQSLFRLLNFARLARHLPSLIVLAPRTAFAQRSFKNFIRKCV